MTRGTLFISNKIDLLLQLVDIRSILYHMSVYGLVLNLLEIIQLRFYYLTCFGEDPGLKRTAKNCDSSRRVQGYTRLVYYN
jgi:hypothetical protein